LWFSTASCEKIFVLTNVITQKFIKKLTHFIFRTLRTKKSEKIIRQSCSNTNCHFFILIFQHLFYPEKVIKSTIFLVSGKTSTLIFHYFKLKKKVLEHVFFICQTY